MLTMYERLMTLPIFKGVGAEQLSSFLEKTNLEFNSYEAGELIVPFNEECRGLQCVLSGSIAKVYTLSGGKARMIVEYGPGKVLGLERLYGMDVRHGHAVKATSQCGTMSFSKSQYISLLKSNNICLINYLNYLNYHCQRIETSLNSLYTRRVPGALATLVALLTDRDCGRVSVKGWRNIIGSDDPCVLREYERELNTMCSWGLVRLAGNDEIVIPSRSALLDYAESNPTI